MIASLSNKRVLTILGTGALLIGPLQATAETTASDDWQYAASLYFFAPAVKGSTASGSDIDVSFDTLIN